MVPVIYAPEAERDLDEITAYIAKDNPKAAEQFGYRLIARAPSFSALFQSSAVLCTVSAVYAFCSRAQFEFTIVWGLLIVLWRFCASGTHTIPTRSPWIEKFFSTVV